MTDKTSLLFRAVLPAVVVMAGFPYLLHNHDAWIVRPLVTSDDQMMLITKKGMIVRSNIAEVRQTGRATQGVRVINLKEGDCLVAVARVDESLDAVVAQREGQPGSAGGQDGGNES